MEYGSKIEGIGEGAALDANSGTVQSVGMRASRVSNATRRNLRPECRVREAALFDSQLVNRESIGLGTGDFRLRLLCFPLAKPAPDAILDWRVRTTSNEVHSNLCGHACAARHIFIIQQDLKTITRMTRFIPSKMKICKSLLGRTLQLECHWAEAATKAARTTFFPCPALDNRRQSRYFFCSRTSLFRDGRRISSSHSVTVMYALSRSSAANIRQLPVIDLAGELDRAGAASARMA